MNILSKIKKADLVGCGGGCFPTAEKWQMVKDARGATKAKYVIMNASEGEPNVEKDGYLLKEHPEQVINGMKLAMDLLSDKGTCVKGFIYINERYYKKYGKKLKMIIAEIFSSADRKEPPIELFKKPHDSGYIGGEETTLINIIEEERAVPRLRPPYPTTEGLWGCPTLVNNVETFYHIHAIASGEYKGERFFSINGDCPKPGVYKLPGDWNMEKALKKTGNFPEYDLFIQVGGGASGEVLNKKQLKRPAAGAMSITLHKLNKQEPKKVIKGWVDFFIGESCGQCTPCREGVYRLSEILASREPDWKLFSELLDNLDETSFCGLGCVVPIPIRSYVKNVLSSESGNVEIDGSKKRMICECFK